MHNISTDSESSAQDTKKQKLEDTNTAAEVPAQDDLQPKPEEVKQVKKYVALFNTHIKHTEAPPKNGKGKRTCSTSDVK